MNFESVRAFVAVAEEGQFRNAADQLGITQQSVSKRIAVLESALDAVLFERVPSGTVLTAEGHRFLPKARAVLLAVEQAVESVQRQPRPLRVDVLNRSLATTDLLRDFYSSTKSIQIDVVATSDMDVMTRGLLDGTLDAGMRYRPRADSPELTQSLVYLEPLQLVVSNQHPLAGCASVRPADLNPFSAWVPGIISGSEWAGFYDELAHAFDLDINSIGPDFGAETMFDTIAGSRSLLTFVGARMRVAAPQQNELVRIPLGSPTPLYPWSITWHSGNQHPGLHGLIAHLRHSFFTPPVPGEAWLPTHVADDYEHGSVDLTV